MTDSGRWVFQNGSAALYALCALALLLALWSGISSGRRRGPKITALLVFLRLLAVGAAAFVALLPAREADLVRAKRPPLAVVVDDSKSMALGPGAPGSPSADWLKKNRNRLKDLENVYRVEYFALGPTMLNPDKGAGLPADLSWFKGESSPIGGSLEEIARMRPDADAMIILTDGRDTERPGRPPQLTVPVFPVAADLPPAPDLWIDAVQAPPVGFIRTPLEIRVRIGATGFPEGTGELSLVEDGAPVLTQLVKIGPNGGEALLTFTPRRTGRKAYRVYLTPRPGEASRANNAEQFTINVIRDKTRILLVAGTPTWDVKAIRRRLSQDPGIDLITFMILRTPADSSTVDPSELSLIPFPTEELFNKELPGFDAVFMVNFDYLPYVPVSYLANLVKFVREAGGGFVLTGGDRSFGLGGYENSPLAEILPVDLSGSSPMRLYLPGPVRPRLTAAGETHPIMRAADTPEKNQRLYQSLPELTGLNWALKEKPGAVTLLEAPQFKNEYGPAPVITVGEEGAGRAMAIMTDGLWKWSVTNVAAGGDEFFYRDFWTRSLRWLVHDPEMELVRLNTPASGVRAGQPVSFTARVLDRDYRPASRADLQGDLTTENGHKTPLVWKESAPGEYITAPVVVGEPGLVKVRVEASLGKVELGRDLAGFAVDPPSPEPLKLGIDRAYLEKLASASGGAVFSDSDSKLFDLLMKRGGEQKEVVGKQVEEPWRASWALVLLVMLLAADWAFRRFME